MYKDWRRVKFAYCVCLLQECHAFLQVFMRMGLCKVNTSDQGTEFNNNLNRELMQLLQIDLPLTAAYHPQACVHVDINTFSPCLHIL